MEREVGREGVEGDGAEVTLDEGAGTLAGFGRLLRAEGFDDAGRVFGGVDRGQEGFEGFALDQAGAADRESREEFEQELGGAGLELEEGFEVFAFVMGAYGVAHLLLDVVETGQPGDGAGHLLFVLQEFGGIG